MSEVLIKVKSIASDVGSAYIQDFAKEKIFTIAGTKFGKWAGFKIIIVEALSGIESSGET